jgi:inorganic pyrophosphatase
MVAKRTAHAGRPSTLEVVIETPAGSRNKFTYDEERRIFRLHKILPQGFSFPFDFGFVPETLAEDGDPLDVMVLGAEPTFTGCVVSVRLLGVIEGNQTAKGTTIRNDRVLATPEGERIRPAARSLSDVPERVLDQIEYFFAAYNRYESRAFEVVKRAGPRAAHALVEAARRKYRAEKKRR